MSIETPALLLTTPRFTRQRRTPPTEAQEGVVATLNTQSRSFFLSDEQRILSRHMGGRLDPTRLIQKEGHCDSRHKRHRIFKEEKQRKLQDENDGQAFLLDFNKKEIFYYKKQISIKKKGIKKKTTT